MQTLSLRPISGLPLVQPGDNLVEMLLVALGDFSLEDGDILVLAQKIVSKAEGAIIDLNTITPSPKALELAQQTQRDPRLCQLYLDEAQEVLVVKGRMVITRHKLGYVGSSSGIDRSNVAPHEEGRVVLLPKDPDASARKIRAGLQERTQRTLALIINDSGGRDYRDGSVGMAIGIAGMAAIESSEKLDLYGNQSHPRIALVDEVAAAASILMGQSNEGVPAVLVRGVQYTSTEDSHISDLLL